MSVRIYALAKDLKLDSKDLVTICNKIGITGKGSALASLEDDEVARVKKYLAGNAGGSGTSSAPPSNAAATTDPAANLTPIRPSIPVTGHSPHAPIRTIGSKPSSAKSTSSSAPAAPSPTATPVEPAPDSPAPVTTPEPVAPVSKEATPVAPPSIAATQVETAPVQESIIAPVSEATVVRPAAPDSPALTRDDYMPLAGSGGKIRVIGSRTSRAPSENKTAADKDKPVDDKAKRPPQTHRAPVINLARIPKSNAPAPPPVSREPAPQRPEIRLTKDAITGHKAGNKAPLEELKQEAATSGNKTRKPAANAPAPPPGGLTEFKANADKARAKHKREGVLSDEDEAEIKRKANAGVAAARAERTKKKRDVATPDAPNRDEEDRRSLRRKTLVRRGNNTAAPRKEKMVLELPCNIRSFSEAAGVPAAKVLRALMSMGKMLTINASMDAELAELVAAELGVDIELKQPESLENEVIQQLENASESEDKLQSRPPIVTFLGHVDHGKTSLLDYLIGTNVVAGEAGGITQHIRAYQVEKDGKRVSFVDTPGHEAFTEMRARGANVTDIAVLVIAADDGIMPQTEEAISHAKAAKVPIVVAMNKIDLPGADPTRVMTQMTEHGLTPSEWGGDVEVVRTSAITGEGMDQLLDTLLTVAELNEYRANPDRPALGVCLEAEQASDRGVIAKVMVQNGTLRVGDIVVCGSSHGRIKALYDTLRPSLQLKEAGPAMPVNITGLDQVPAAGDRFHVLSDITQAREIAESRQFSSRAQTLSGSTTRVSFESFQEQLQAGTLGKKDEKALLNLIVRADVRGSLEAIDKELAKLEHPEVDIRVLQRSVGGISVADVTLAHASQAVIVGFNVIPDEAARALAEDRNVEIRRYDIIYKLAEDIKAIVEGRLRPEERVIELGRALVKTVFAISRVGAIAGCYVMQGSIERGCRIRVNRENRTIGDYALESLKRHKDDAKEVPRGMECGIKLAGFNDIKQDDVLEAYKIEEVARKLD